MRRARAIPSAPSPRSSSPAPTARARSPRWSTPRCAPPAIAARATPRRTSYALEERFVIDGAEVDAGALEPRPRASAAAAERSSPPARFERCPTFFECTTAAAFDLFRDAGVDVAVLEVGLGGRLDATNIVTPIAAAIVSIDFDHQAQLGDTLASIAAEKAGIIKPGIPVVCGPLPAEALAVIAAVCARARRAR